MKMVLAATLVVCLCMLIVLTAANLVGFEDAICMGVGGILANQVIHAWEQRR